MRRVANIIFIIVGIIIPILIGALHTLVHFTDLVRNEVQEALRSPILILGAEQPLWNTWGLMSFMMGTSFIIIGLLNISAHLKNKGNYPPLMNIIVMIVYLTCVLYASKTFHALPQFYGSLIFMPLCFICLYLSWKGKQIKTK